MLKNGTVEQLPPHSALDREPLDKSLLRSSIQKKKGILVRNGKNTSLLLAESEVFRWTVLLFFCFWKGRWSLNNRKPRALIYSKPSRPLGRSVLSWVRQISKWDSKWRQRWKRKKKNEPYFSSFWSGSLPTTWHTNSTEPPGRWGAAHDSSCRIEKWWFLLDTKHNIVTGLGARQMAAAGSDDLINLERLVWMGGPGERTVRDVLCCAHVNFSSVTCLPFFC